MGVTAQRSADAVRAWPEDLLKRSNFLLCKLSNVAKRELVEQLAAEDLELPHHRLPHLAVLSCLADSGPACQKDIAERLRIDGSDMVAVLDDLEHGGHVTRVRDPRDRRRHAVSITPAGPRSCPDPPGQNPDFRSFLAGSSYSAIRPPASETPLAGGRAIGSERYTWTAWPRLWVPVIRAPQAACAYSWISPPSRSRSTTLPAGTTAGSSGPSGDACPKARCGRWQLLRHEVARCE